MRESWWIRHARALGRAIQAGQWRRMERLMRAGEARALLAR